MAWRDRIAFNPKVLYDKPIIKGTRISVEFVLNLLRRRWNREQILAEYDHLKPEDIQACLDLRDSKEYQAAIDRLRREIQIGIDELDRGEYEEFDDDSLKEFFEQIKREGRRELDDQSGTS